MYTGDTLPDTSCATMEKYIDNGVGLVLFEYLKGTVLGREE